MSTFSGKWRTIPGASSGRIRNSIFNFRGDVWELMNDGFFGYSSVDYDWSDPADAAKLVPWTFSADASMVSQVNIVPGDHHVEIVAASGDVDGFSNLRQLHTVTETATWGVSHAQGEIYGGPKFLSGGTLDEGRLVIKPQHGLGLRAQEDTKRRTIIAWHDIVFGIPQFINLGVWSGNTDGTGFLNRQVGLFMDLAEVHTPTACEQVCDDDAGMIFDGAVGNWQTPDDPSIDITGDWSATFDISPADWTPAGHNSIWSKYNTGSNQRSYRFRLTNAGAIEVSVSTDGTGATVKNFATDAAGTAVLAALPNGARRTIVIDYDADNGAAGTSVRFHVAPGWDGPYTQLGAAVTVAGATVAHSGTAVGEFGAAVGGTIERFTGRIHQLEIRPARWDSTGNSLTIPAVDVRCQQVDNGVTSFVGKDGKSWTRSGTSTVENTQTPVGTVTLGAHSLRIGDRVGIIVGDELSVTALQRTGGSACQCTLPGGHSITSGSFVRILNASEASFDGTFAVNVSGNTMTWVDAGSNISGHTAMVWDNTYDRATAMITAVTATTFDYETFGRTAVIPVGAGAAVIREFPYFMELRVAGTVASVRCWGRHQTVPGWLDQDRALTCDLSKAGRAFTVTLRERTANVATLTIGAHDLIVGDRVTLAGVEATFNASDRVVTGIGATTVSYVNVGSDVGSTASSGTCTVAGAGSAADINGNPCPVGTGRVAFINAHLGTNDLSKCVYGPFFGDNSFDSQVVVDGDTPFLERVVEREIARPVTEPTTAVNGVATGLFGGTFTGSGNPATQGTAAGLFGGSFPAAGNPRTQGAATGLFGATFTADGKPTVSGQATGLFGGSFVGSGNPRTQGAATGLFGATFTAVGNPRTQGQATGLFGGDFPAAGKGVSSGVATGLFGFAATGAGVARTVGSATGLFGGDFQASGSSAGTVVGVASGLFGFDGTALGVARTMGAAAGAFGATTSALGVTRTVGVASGLFGFSGVAAGVTRAVGACTGLFGGDFVAQSLVAMDIPPDPVAFGGPDSEIVFAGRSGTIVFRSHDT